MPEIITNRCPLSGEEVQLYANDNGVSTNCEHCKVARMSFRGRAFDRAREEGYPLDGEIPFCELRLDPEGTSMKRKLITAFENSSYGEIRCRLTYFKRV